MRSSQNVHEPVLSVIRVLILVDVDILKTALVALAGLWCVQRFEDRFAVEV